MMLTPYEICGWLGWGSSPCWWLHGEEGRGNRDLVCTDHFTLTDAAPYMTYASQPGQEWELHTLYGGGHTGEQGNIWRHMKDLIQRTEGESKLMQLDTMGRK